jgi:hypothetical protein
MKNLFLIFVLFYLSSAVYSQSGSVTVSGAGVPQINTTYTFHAIGNTGRPEYRVGGNFNQRINFVLPANKWAMVYNDPAPGTGLRYCNDSQAMDVPITGWYACNEGYTPVPSSIILTPLPVKIKTFTAELNLNLPLISFTTASEINNAGFDIEQSSDGIDFQKIGWVEGNGSTTEEKHYTFIDTKPSLGINYYRLRQVDYDGRFEYSKIVSLMMNSDDVIIFPNPVTDILNVQNAASGSYLIKSVLGTIISQGELNAGGQIDISHLPSGTYLFYPESGRPLIFNKL